MLLVIKLGGSILEEHVSDSFVNNLKEVLKNHQIILVHGGRKIVNEVSSKMGKEQEFIVSPKGFRSRYTDKETMEIFTMVMAGKLNKNLVSSLLQNGINAIGLCGVDAGMVKASRKKELIVVDERGRRRIIDGGYTGQIEKVNTHLLNILLKHKYTPLIAPIAIGEEYEKLNVDGDRMAASIAKSLNADLLILLTDVEGLRIKGQLVNSLTTNELKEVLPKIGHGMITKIYAAMEALEGGINEVIITSGLTNDPITTAIEHSHGTLITHE